MWLGGAAAASSASCTGCDDEGRVTITFRFDKDVPCGHFVDGSPWIADEGGGVNIVEILPAVTADCGADTCNGWMIDVSSTHQALDARKSFDASVAPGDKLDFIVRGKVVRGIAVKRNLISNRPPYAVPVLHV